MRPQAKQISINISHRLRWLHCVLLLVHKDDNYYYSHESLSAHSELGNLLTYKFQSQFILSS